MKNSLSDLCPYEIMILKDGTWLHEGAPIKRLPLVKLFSTVLSRDDDGNHWLITPVERGMIEVEDSAFVTKDLTVEEQVGTKFITITTNIDQTFTIGRDHPIVIKTDDTGTSVPYVVLDKNLEARIIRNHYYELAKIAVPDTQDQNLMGVWSGGVFHVIGKAKDE